MNLESVKCILKDVSEAPPFNRGNDYRMLRTRINIVHAVKRVVNSEYVELSQKIDEREML